MGNNAPLNDKLQILGNLGQPSGMVIEPFDKTAPIQPIGQENNIDTEPIQIKDVDMGNNYFSNLLKQAPQEHKSIMNVAQKLAASGFRDTTRLAMSNVEMANDMVIMNKENIKDVVSMLNNNINKLFNSDYKNEAKKIKHFRETLYQ